MRGVPGVRIGHHTDRAAGTGCTVIIPPPETVAAVWVGGGGPATRETDLLGPLGSVQHASALLFTGGSAFGLAAAGGVVRWCEEQGIGHDTGAARVPIVPAAAIYDLGITGGLVRPGADAGEAACRAARPGAPERGSVGAGTGATLGKLRGQAGWCKGGVGAGERRTYEGASVTCLAVVNAWGDVMDERGEVLGGAVRPDGRFAGAADRVLEAPPEHPRLAAPENTTLACVVTDGRLTKIEALAVARMASAGMARAVNPIGTPFDGDAVFCLATGDRPTTAFACGVAAAEALADAVRDAVRSAATVRGVPTAAERRAVAGSGAAERRQAAASAPDRFGRPPRARAPGR